MKKNLIIAIIFFVSIFYGAKVEIFGQIQNAEKDLSNELNLKEYVAKQIEKAKIKEMNSKVNNEKKRTSDNSMIVIHQYENKKSFEFYFMLLAVFISIISLSFLFFNIINYKKIRNNEVKENIKNIREENLTEINKLQDKIIAQKSRLKIKKQSLDEVDDEYLNKEAEKKYVPIGELELAYKLKKMKVSR
ncbi:MAG: hypothetical protein STSR0008_15430 [Ignavibacterium sp.]